MFSPEIVESEEFLSMPVSSQALYFHLGMNADDDGFIQPQKTMRLVGSNQDDLKVLLTKRFILPFDSGVVVIKHWLIHNMIRLDRYKPTRFQEEKKRLGIKENKAYTDNLHVGLQSGNQPAPQVRLGKDNKYTADADFFYEEENPRKKPDKAATSEYEEMCRWAEKRRGFPFVRKLKQYSSLKVAKENNISKSRLKERWIKQEGESWREGKVDWTTVISSFDKEA